MKRLSVVGGIIGSFLLAGAMTAAAQEEHTQQEERKQERASPARQESAKPEEHKNQEPPKDERQRVPKQQDERQMKQQQQEQQKIEKQDEKQQEKMEKQQGREEQRHEQAQPQEPMHGGQQARAPQRENQRRISDHDFHAHFGREHRFAPGRMQVYDGRPQFAYSGYVFELVEVWPADWAYDADEYYIDYFDDEYWLCSFTHPEIRLELIIVG